MRFERKFTGRVAAAVAGGVEEMVRIMASVPIDAERRESLIRWGVGALRVAREMLAGGGEFREIAPEVAEVLSSRTRGGDARTLSWMPGDLMETCAFYLEHRAPALEAALRGERAQRAQGALPASLLPWPYYRYLLRRVPSPAARGWYERKAVEKRWSLPAMRRAVRGRIIERAEAGTS